MIGQRDVSLAVGSVGRPWLRCFESIHARTGVTAEQLAGLRGRLRSFCYQMLGSPFDAEDAVQDVLERAWRARGQYDLARSSVATWCFRIARKVCVDRLRETRRGPEQGPTPSASLASGHPSSRSTFRPMTTVAPRSRSCTAHAVRPDRRIVASASGRWSTPTLDQQDAAGGQPGSRRRPAVGAAPPVRHRRRPGPAGLRGRGPPAASGRSPRSVRRGRWRTTRRPDPAGRRAGRRTGRCAAPGPSLGDCAGRSERPPSRGRLPPARPAGRRPRAGTPPLRRDGAAAATQVEHDRRRATQRPCRAPPPAPPSARSGAAGRNTPGATVTRRPAKSAQPNTCSSGSPAARASISRSRSVGSSLWARIRAASSSANTQPAARNRVTTAGPEVSVTSVLLDHRWGEHDGRPGAGDTGIVADQAQHPFEVARVGWRVPARSRRTLRSPSTPSTTSGMAPHDLSHLVRRHPPFAVQLHECLDRPAQRGAALDLGGEPADRALVPEVGRPGVWSPQYSARSAGPRAAKDSRPFSASSARILRSMSSRRNQTSRSSYVIVEPCAFRRNTLD